MCRRKGHKKLMRTWAPRQKAECLKSWSPDLMSGGRENTAVGGSAGCVEWALGAGAEEWPECAGQEMGLSKESWH